MTLYLCKYMFIMFTENIADGRPILYATKAYPYKLNLNLLLLFFYITQFSKYLKTETRIFDWQAIIVYEDGNMTVCIDVLNTGYGMLATEQC